MKSKEKTKKGTAAKKKTKSPKKAVTRTSQKAQSRSTAKSQAKTQTKAKATTGAKVTKKAGSTARIQKAIRKKVITDTRKKQAELVKKVAEAKIPKEKKSGSSLVKEDLSPLNANRERLILTYAPLIKYIAQRIAARLPANIELDDLISSGVIGLMDAIDKYDASRDNKFKTYAEFRIRGAILDELRAQDWVPRSVREKAKQLERCYTKIEQAKGRQATDEEVCEELKLSQEEYHELLNQVRSVSLLSFDDFASFSKADKRSLQELGQSGGPSGSTPFNELNSAALKRMIADSIKDLPEKQRLVLSLYYYEDLNLKEIGRVLDVTESRVSQLHTQAVLRLRSRLRNYWEEFSAVMA